MFSKDIDVFICVESWFSAQHDESSTSINGYVGFRDDRVARIGGGVALWIRDTIALTLLPCNHPEFFECLVIRLTTMRVILFAAYLPPDAISRHSLQINEFIISYLDTALTNFPDDNILLAGDFNRLDVNDLCCSLNLCNMNNRPTYGNAELDYILLSESLKDDYTIDLCSPFDISKVPHLSLIALPKTKREPCKTITRKVFDLRSSFVDKFVKMIQVVDWDFIHDSSLSIDNKCIVFHAKLKKASDKCIPVSFVKCTPRDKPWITPLVKDLINKRWNAFRLKNFVLYNRLKIKVRCEIKKAKMSWTKSMEEKDLWKTVNQCIGRKSSSAIMSLLCQFDSTLSAVNAINAYLKSVFVPSDPSNQNIISDNDLPWLPDVSPANVHKLLSRLQTRKSSPDLPNILYNKAASSLALPLSCLFKMSLESGIVPRTWKSSVVTPIPKTRTPNVGDIRPISLITPVAKILERIILTSLKEKFLDCYDSKQFGFRPNSSTLCALASLHNCVTNFLEDSSIFGVLIIAYDYSKAFDRLRSDLIIKRLIDEKFPSMAVQWISNYLNGRSQTVKIGLTESFPVTVTSGVPQGSILGPFLYSFTTATFSPCDGNQCKMFKYADDTTLVFPLYKITGNSHVIREHSNLLRWSDVNDLKMNVRKCKAMIIRKPNIRMGVIDMPDDVVEAVHLNILGVMLNHKCTWSTHIDYIIKKCSRLLFAFRQIRGLFSAYNLKRLYFSLVLSVIDYCAPLYVGLSTTDANRLNRLQKRFHRVICGPSCDKDCLPPLEQRRLMLTMRFLNKVMAQGHILHHELPKRSQTGRFILPLRKTERRSKSVVLFACKEFNANFVRSYD
jgi:hypothetical protein